MPDELFTKISSQVKEIDTQIAKGKDYIRLLKDMGEDTLSQENKMKELERKAAKFKKAMADRGY